MKRIMLMISALTLIAGLTACGQQTTAEESGVLEETVTKADDAFNADAGSAAAYDTLSPYNIITVNSTENVSVVPDIAEVVYSVRTEDSSASGCQQKNSRAVDQVVTLLKDLGVAEASIQTSDYYMNPVYNYSGSTPKLTGYQSTTTLTVSDLPIDDLDNILAQSVSTGINTVQSITYQASRYDESYQEALTKAVASAYEKAQVLAAASGACVGNVISIRETSGYSQARYTDYTRSSQINSYGSAKMEALEDATAIMPGEIQVEAGILVEYQLIYE